MDPLPPITLRLRGRKVIGRLAFALLLILSISIGAAVGLLFVYSSDLPAVHALEDYQPNVVTEVYADDGAPIGSFALQRRILLTYEQIPPALRDAVTSAEDQHFFEHWGVDLPRALQAAWRNLLRGHISEGASTLTMQLAGTLFLDRSDRSFRRKIQEVLLAIQIERHYTKQQILAMYCNQIYLSHGQYGMEAASEFYFGKPVGKLTLAEAATLAGIIRGPSYSPVLHPTKALARRNTVLGLMAREGKISELQAHEASETPLGLHLQYPRNDLAPYFFEEIRRYLETTYGTEAVHERGLRVYTTLNIKMQEAANQSIRDGLHAYDRRHGWRGKLPNIFADHLGTLQSYDDDDWHHAINKDDYVNGLVLSVDKTAAIVKIGQYRAVVGANDFTWTGKKDPTQLFKPGDVGMFKIREIDGSTVKVDVEQHPTAQAALVGIENVSGEVKAMVGGYSFDESKFNRATQAYRQVGSSFKVYVYALAMERGMSPFDTIVDAPLTLISGGQSYSPHNYDDKFEGTITLRRALDGSRNVPAVKLADRVGIQNVVAMAKQFGITSPLPPYLPLALGAADMRLIEHTSAFTVFPNDGIRVEPHLIRKVTAYDGALLEEARPAVHDVISPETARTMVAMLEDAVQHGTGVKARSLGRPVAGKTGTTNDFTDAWFMGFSPTMTAGVWVGNDDKQISLGKKETGAMAALPIWIQFMQTAMEGTPVQDFPNVVPLDKQATTHFVTVDTPDLAPTEPSEQGLPVRATTDTGDSEAAPPAAGATATGTATTAPNPGASTTPGAPSTTTPAAKPDSKEPPKKPGRGPGTPQ
jgi:penicillin-binding protein 1A